MKTSAILSPANITQNLSAGKQVEGANAETPFKQVLSRETSKVSARETSNSAPQNQVQPSNNAKAKTADADNAKDATTNTTDDSEAAQDAASTEMLALVANLASAAPVVIDAAASEAVAADAPPAIGLGAGKGILSADLAATAVADKLSTAVDVQGLQEQTPSTGLAADAKFQAALQAAGAGDKPALQPRDAALATGAAQSELAAAKLAAKDAAPKSAPDASANASRNTESQTLPDLAGMSKADKQSAPPALDLIAAKLQDATVAPSAPMQGQIQQATFAASQALAANQTEKLTPQVGSPGWDQALGQKVVWMVGGGQQSASLTLNPPDLGPLQVVLNVSNSQATASFTAAQPEVRQALEAAMPKLREMLADSGIQLGQTTVSTGMPNQNSGPGDQAAQSQRHFGRNEPGADLPTPVARPVVTGGGQGLVDTFA